ncbi:cupin domain-containing protein [Streptomyces sp. NPDC059785]|uniref:cupin domain-containing protein n=1 Tax=Streptomyces sp. NPDC059785 TaxID=3346945 RepID=UPI00364F60A3
METSLTSPAPAATGDATGDGTGDGIRDGIEWFGLNELLAAGRQSLTRVVGDPDAFFARHWESTPLIATGGPADAFADLMTLQDFDRILTEGPVAVQTLHAVDASQALPAERLVYYRDNGTGPLADPGRVLDAFGAGATLVLHGLHRWWPPLRRLCQELSAVLSHRVVADAYLTPPGTTGHLRHYDTHDLFTLQIAGSKHWLIEEPTVALPLSSQHNTAERLGPSTTHFDGVLAAGTSMYLPRGYLHTVSSRADTSLHITLGIEAVTWKDALSTAVRRHAEREQLPWRRVLPAGFARPGAPDPLSPAVTQVPPYQEMVAWARERFWRHEFRSAHAGRLLSMVAAADGTTAGSGRTVRRAPGIVVRARHTGDQYVVSVDDKDVRLPAAIADDVRLLLAGAPVRPAQLRTATGPNAEVLLSRLVQEGILQIVDG